MLRKESLLSIADGLDAFRVRVPAQMIGKTLGESQFRQSTGCNVIAIEENGACNTRLTSETVLNDNAQLIVVGDADAGHKLFETTAGSTY
jgi:K+/H+ antiporter YhaU regulatory subunit KhtT